MSSTPYSETEALLRALEEVEGNAESSTHDYLREHFLPNELRKLASAAELLAEACTTLARQAENAHLGPGCPRHHDDPHNLCPACWALEP